MKSTAKGRNDIHKIDMEVTPKELECIMQQAVLSRDAEDLSGFVTMFDVSGNLCRQYDDGHKVKLVSTNKNEYKITA